MSNSEPLSNLFLQAVELPTWDERHAFVDQRCGDNSELATNLLQMLRVHHKASGFLSQPPAVALPSQGDRIGRDSVVGRMTQEFELSPTQENGIASPAGDQSTKAGQTELSPRYQVHGEIARGGMGAIVKAKDVDLGRTLAIKVLLDEHRDNPAIAERFIEEAQIGGQLQHPGITPVYELGAMPDKRPFFSMKLVKGQTLAALFKERKDLADQRSRLLGIFEQVCQTMAYAHSRRVIHRDLKPANIMVGAFGEVQVMDWGLAKVLKTGGIADEKRARDTKLGQSLIQTVRSGSNHPQAAIGTRKGAGSAGAETHAGSVMGTPAYMPPEQALGEIERLDERCDAFGLGAILCEILTGAPPYVSDDQSELFRQAARGKLDECYQRLDACGADQTLIDIAKASLAPEVEDRLRNARELSDQITEYLESVETRLRRAEVERAAEVARVEESRKRRKVITALAASIVLMATIAGSGALWFQSQTGQRRQAATTQLAEFVNEAKLHQSLAENDNLAKRSDEIKKAIASAELALGLFDGSELTDDQRPPVEELLNRLVLTSKDVQTQLAQQGEDDKLRDRLEVLRLDLAGGKTELNVASELATAKSRDQATEEKYTQLFLDAGIDIHQLPVDKAAQLVQQSSLSHELIAGLDQWTALVKEPPLSVLIAEATVKGIWDVGIASIRQSIADGEAGGRFKAEPYIGLAAMLILSGQHDEYRALCRELVFDKPYPGGYVLAERVSKACLLLPTDEMGVSPNDLPVETFAKSLDDGRVAPTITAYVWGTRALAAYRQDQFDDCLQYTEKAEAADGSPLSGAIFLAVRAMAQQRMDQQAEARETFSELQTTMDEIQTTTGRGAYRQSHDALVAFLLYREAKQLHDPEREPVEFASWADLSTTPDLSAISQHEFRAELAAIANKADEDTWRIQVRQALLQRDTTVLTELAESDNIGAQSPELAAWFATELRRKDKVAEAIQVLQAAYEHHPDDFWINYEMGRCLSRQAEHGEALGYSRAAVALRPESAGARWSLSIALAGADQPVESNLVFDRLLVDSSVSHENYPTLIDDLYDRGHYDKAQRITEKWLAEFPNNADAHSWMSKIFNATNRFKLSLDWAEKTLALNPKDYGASFYKAYSFSKLKRWEEAKEAYRELIKLRPDSYGAHNNLGNTLRNLGDLEGAEAAFREALRLQPGYRQGLTNLIRVLKQKQRRGGGAAPGTLREPGLYFEIKRLTGELARSEQNDIATNRERLQLNPRDSRTRSRLIYALRKIGKLQEATSEAEKGVAFDPDSADTHRTLGSLYQEQGDLDRAIEQFRITVELDSEQAGHHNLLGRALAEKATGIKSGPGISRLNGALVLEYSEVILTPEQEKLVDEAIEHFEYVAAAANEGGAPPFLSGQLAELLRLRGRDEEAEKIEQATSERFDKLFSEFRNKREATGQEVPALPATSTRQFNQLRVHIQRLSDEGKVDTALESIRKYEENNPRGASNPILLFNKAFLHIENEEAEKGIAIYQEMIDAGVMLGYMGLARYHRDQGNFEEAEKYCRDGIEALPDSDEERYTPSRLYGELAEVYALQNRREDELAIYDLILDADDSPDAVLKATRGKYELDGDLTAALDRSAKWRFSGGYPPSLGLWAWLLVVEPGEDGNFANLDPALGYARDASQRPLRGNSLNTITNSYRLTNYLRTREGIKLSYSGKNTLGMVHFRRREYQQALQALQEFYDLGFEEPGNWLFLAMTHWKLDNQDEARKWLKKATDYLDREDYRIRHSEKLFRAEAEKLISGNEGRSHEGGSHE